MYRKGLLAAAITVLSGCATPVVDNTPANPTSVVKVKLVMNGLLVPDHTGQQTVYTRADRRRIHTIRNHDSFLMRWLDADESDIFRLDQNKVWMVNHRKETYTECPISGCVHRNPLEEAKASGKKSEDEAEYKSYEERACKVDLANNDFTVKATGSTRKFGNLDAQEYTAEWKIDFKDKLGKKDTNLVRFVFWTTTPTAEMNQAWAVHREATNAYLAQQGDDPLRRLVGNELFLSISAFTGDIEKTDKKQYNAVTRKLSQIKGYPLSIKFEWFQKLEACQEPKEQTQKEETPTSLQGFAKSMLSSLAKEKRQEIVDEWMKEPRIRYIYEITDVQQELVKDSVFEVPSGYRMVDRQ